MLGPGPTWPLSHVARGGALLGVNPVLGLHAVAASKKFQRVKHRIPTLKTALKLGIFFFFLNSKSFKNLFKDSGAAFEGKLS